MRSKEQIAAEIIECCLKWEPAARVLGDVTAMELAALARLSVERCPLCTKAMDEDPMGPCPACFVAFAVKKLSELRRVGSASGMESNPATPGPGTATLTARVELRALEHGDELRLVVEVGDDRIVDARLTDEQAADLASSAMRSLTEALRRDRLAIESLVTT